MRFGIHWVVVKVNDMEDKDKLAIIEKKICLVCGSDKLDTNFTTTDNDRIIIFLGQPFIQPGTPSWCYNAYCHICQSKLEMRNDSCVQGT